MRASEFLAEFNKGVGKDPRSRLDALESFLRAQVAKEEPPPPAPAAPAAPAPRRAAHG
jgi:hypothetical protein